MEPYKTFTRQLIWYGKDFRNRSMPFFTGHSSYLVTMANPINQFLWQPFSDENNGVEPPNSLPTGLESPGKLITWYNLGKQQQQPERICRNRSYESPFRPTTFPTHFYPCVTFGRISIRNNIFILLWRKQSWILRHYKTTKCYNYKLKFDQISFVRKLRPKRIHKIDSRSRFREENTLNNNTNSGGGRDDSRKSRSLPDIGREKDTRYVNNQNEFSRLQKIWRLGLGAKLAPIYARVGAYASFKKTGPRDTGCGSAEGRWEINHLENCNTKSNKVKDKICRVRK
jgi:hypothetical protein